MFRGRKLAQMAINPPKKIPPEDHTSAFEESQLITLADLGVPEAVSCTVEETYSEDEEIKADIENNNSTSIIESSPEQEFITRSKIKRFSVTSQELGLTKKQKLTDNVCERNTPDKEIVIHSHEGDLSNYLAELKNSQQDDHQFPSISGIHNNVMDDDFDSDDSVADVTWEPPARTARTAFVADSDVDDATDGNESELANENQMESATGNGSEPATGNGSEPANGNGSEPPNDIESEPVDGNQSEPATGNESAPVDNNVNLREIVNRTTQPKPRSSKIITRRKKQENKNCRNTGQAYHSYGKDRPARQMKELSMCRYNCKSKIPEQVRKDLFERYWQLGSYDKRVQYIGSLITVEEKKMCKVNTVKNRFCTFGYHIHWGTEIHEKVCKQCFMAIFDETAKFVYLQAIKKRDSKTGMLPESVRGRISIPKWSENDLENVQKHILSFPQYESHYGRNKTSKKFLPSILTLDKMYSLYCIDNPENERVCKTIYTKLFHSENLSFKPPKVDTCTKCDKLQAKIQYCKTPAEKEELVKELNEHQDKATRAYDQKKDDKILLEFDESLVVLTFDLQQCLPTPMLSSGVAFYKRSLWTFNLTIHDCRLKTATCYMWHEGIGKRGGNQIASCLYDYIKNLPGTVKRIVLYSDTCGGQNKNSLVAAMFLTIMKECPHIEVIDHKFLVPGHTHMECDYDHSVIEKAKKRIAAIHLPRDYYQMVRSAGKRGQFIVREMILEKFYNFEILLKGPMVLRKINTDKEKVHWPDITWFRYTQTEDLLVQYKKDLTNESAFLKLSFKRQGKSRSLPLALTVISETTLPISVEKKKDLMDLLPFIDSECHDFYRSLKTSENERAEEDPDLDILMYDADKDQDENN